MRPPFLSELVARLRLLSSELVPSRADEHRGPATYAGEADAAPADPDDADEVDEFREMLDELSAVPAPEDWVSALALKDATIAELRKSLEQLRPMGEEHALATIWRNSTDAALASLRALCAELTARLEATHAQPVGSAARIAELEQELQQQAAASLRHEERFEALRHKYEERRKVAAERWRELRTLRADRRRLERELERCRQTGSDPSAPASLDEACEPDEPCAGE